MESRALQSERLRAAQLRSGTRTSASSSASSSKTHTAPKNVDEPTETYQTPHSHSGHRYYHASCLKPSDPQRQGPYATSQTRSREGSTKLARARQTAISSLLQEKLDRERKSESEKAAAMSRPQQGIGLNTSLEHERGSKSSLAKSWDSDSRRPQSSGGSEMSKGLALKEMENVMSTLHKQNFDLKLELFHRRERQTSLENRLEALETEVEEMVYNNEKLLEEVDKRDKAVEEAVEMIVKLEASLAKLSTTGASESDQTPTPRDSLLYPESATPKLDDDIKTLNHMPSFVSEPVENAENLRNVYLGIRGSVISQPPVEEGGDNVPPMRLESPSLSLLSESSFVSVYGQKGQDSRTNSLEDETKSVGGVDGPSETGGMGDLGELPSKTRSTRGTKRSTPVPSANDAATYQSLGCVISEASPLKHTERSHLLKRERDRLESERKNTPTLRSVSGTVCTRTNQRESKVEAREPPRMVMTDASGGFRLDSGLPPTPDSLSTTIFRGYRNLEDNLERKQMVNLGKSFESGSDQTAQEGSFFQSSSGMLLDDAIALATLVSQGRDSIDSFITDNWAAGTQQLQFSNERMVSHGKGNDWNSDSDDSDAQSFESEFDIWLRESTKSGSRPKADQVLPELLKPKSKSVAMDAMVSASTPHGEDVGVNTNLNPDKMYDLFPVQELLFGNATPPPPPNRRSSLLAKTGTRSRTGSIRTGGNSLPVSPEKPKCASCQTKDTVPVQKDTTNTPVQKEKKDKNVDKNDRGDEKDERERQCPPAVGQKTSRSGLNRLFRRSLGVNKELNSRTLGQNESVVQLPPRSALALGFSSLTASGGDTSDLDSAEPPPIERKSRPQRASSVHSQRHVSIASKTEALKMESLQVPARTAQNAPIVRGQTPQAEEKNPRSPTPTGQRRKWLVKFGKSKNKAN